MLSYQKSNIVLSTPMYDRFKTHVDCKFRHFVLQKCSIEVYYILHNILYNLLYINVMLSDLMTEMYISKHGLENVDKK